MSAEDLYLISETGESVITEKRSKFLGLATRVFDEESAVSIISARKKEHYDARHNCYAYIISNSSISRCSDDGEPSQTAGAPILEAMNAANLVDAIVIVTRYFGGTLLGTGGLTRAYREAATAAIENATLSAIRTGYNLRFSADYSIYGSIEYLLREYEIPICDSTFTSTVTIGCIVPIGIKPVLSRDITELSGGTVKMEWGETVRYYVANNQVVVL